MDIPQQRILMGNEAIARGALEAGVQVAVYSAHPVVIVPAHVTESHGVPAEPSAAAIDVLPLMLFSQMPIWYACPARNLYGIG